MKRTGIIAAGNWIIDRVKTIDRYPAEGESCMVLEEEKSGGGGPCNVLCDLAAMGVNFPLYAAGRVGDDADGRWLLEDLVRRQIDISMMHRDPAAPTSASDVLSGRGRRTFLIARGANARLCATDFGNPFPEAKIFYLGYLLLLDALDAFDPEFGTGAARLLNRMQRAGLKTVVDFVAVDPERYAREIPAAMRHTDVLVINELEAGYSTGIAVRDHAGEIDRAALAACARCFFHFGVREAVVFHYPEGAFVMESDGAAFYFRSYSIDPSELIGSNGAGDAFCAGILYALHEELPWTDAAALANASAWFNLKHPTASGGAVALAELRKKIGKECCIYGS